MPRITALLHTQNDVLRLGRALETLYPCDQILIIDHGSQDATVRIAREHGARVLPAIEGNGPSSCLRAESLDWILALDVCESLSEGLAASLFEWKMNEPAGNSAFSVRVREESSAGWNATHPPQTRLVPANWARWNGKLPEYDPSSVLLAGDLLRFAFP